MSDKSLEEGTVIEVVIANINRKDRDIILSLRALEKQEFGEGGGVKLNFY